MNPTRWLLVFCAILAALVLDMVLVPTLGCNWIQTHFTGGLVVLVGLRRGSRYGLLTGWVAGFLGSLLSGEPLGLAMGTLGLVGFLSGGFVGMRGLLLPGIEGLVLLVLLFAENIFADVLGQLLYDAAPWWGIIGLPLTALAFLPVIIAVPRRERASDAALWGLTPSGSGGNKLAGTSGQIRASAPRGGKR